MLSEGEAVPNASQLSAMTRLFSSAVFKEMAKKRRSTLFARLLHQTGFEIDSRSKVADVFDESFRVLRDSGRRDEYIYRSALTQKVLLGKHSLNTASMLNEFRAGNCKADLVILNGTATVYEIKSERDSLDRLTNQVENYKRVFAKVCVIAGDEHVQKVLGLISKDVGVLRLSRRYQISTEREADDRPERICPATVFESLRMSEAEAILVELGGEVPNVPNTQLHAEMRKRFSELDPSEVHHAMVGTLKRTRDLAPLGALVEKLPASLQAAALSVKVNRNDHQHLIEAIETPLKVAATWT